MKEVVLVGIGGFLGSVARYRLGLWLMTAFPGSLPLATLSINLLGCFLIGMLGALGEKRGVLTPEARLFLMTGVLGGFTTFSAFGFETFQLLRGAKPGVALLYAALSVFGGLLMVGLGWWLVGLFSRSQNSGASI